MTATGAPSDERNSARDARDLLERYQRAMLAFDADALAGLYAPDAVHEFPFTTPGHAARYESADEVRAAYRRVWANRRVALGALRNVAAHQSDDTIVSEWTAGARLIDDPSSTFDLAGVLVITARDGRISRVRDDMDVLGLAHRTGRLLHLAQHLSGQEATTRA